MFLNIGKFLRNVDLKMDLIKGLNCKEIYFPVKIIKSGKHMNLEFFLSKAECKLNDFKKI